MTSVIDQLKELREEADLLSSGNPLSVPYKWLIRRLDRIIDEKVTPAQPPIAQPPIDKRPHRRRPDGPEPPELKTLVDALLQSVQPGQPWPPGMGEQIEQVRALIRGYQPRNYLGFSPLYDLNAFLDRLQAWRDKNWPTSTP